MPTVTGIIRTEDGSPALGATVRAYDKDMRSEQLLGEVLIEERSGRYEITYTAEQFSRAEKKSADLIVRAFDEDGTLRAESNIVFNAGEEERVDLVLGPVPEPPPPRDRTELEQLQEAIEPVREGVAYRDFTDRDLEFLSHEVGRRRRFPFLAHLVLGRVPESSPPRNRTEFGLERRILHTRLGFLRRADQFANQTGIPLAAFYGWFRVFDNRLFELDELLDRPSAELREALERAIAENIIPDITGEIPEILERLRALRFERGRLVHHRFVAQLIGVFDDGTEQPLAGHLVEVTDLDAEPEERNLGVLTTDGRGVCVLAFPLPGDAPDDATRPLQLTIRDEETMVAEAEIEARAHQEEVAEVRVRMPEEDEPDDALDGVGMAEEVREVLRADGLRHLVDVPAISRAEFVNRYGERVGDAGAYVEYEAARESSKILYHVINSAWLENVTTPDDEPDDPDIPTGVNETLSRFKKCGCKDCDSAVSPAAYLAHLLEWTLEHVKDVEDSITFSQLEEEFHQPFGDLPASCQAVEEQVRQVRICVEVLWRFTEFRELSDLQMPTSFRNAYRHLRNQLYRAILTNLGTSFEQLRKATLNVEGDSSSAELVASQRRAVASMLGIDEAHLEELFFNVEQPPISPSEEELERLFGYKNTRADDVFATPGRPDLVDWQRKRLETIWQEQDWSVDSYSGEGRLPFVDPAIIDSSYLRTPLDENPAFDLLEARQAALAEHRQETMAFDPQQNGLADLVDEVLGESINELRELHETLQSTDATEEDIEQAHGTIASLHLTPAGFSHLMELDARIEAGEPVGATDEETDAAWTAVFDVLSRAHRHSSFVDWVEEEEELDLVLGPKLFWFPVEPAPQPNPWQATGAERVAWEEALRQRSSRPIIDPDQIGENDFIHIVFFVPPTPAPSSFPVAQPSPPPPLTSYQLWQSRREWIDERLGTLRQSRQGQPTPLDALQEMLEASALGIDLNIFAELSDLEAEGADLQLRLTQLSLSLPAYRFLADVHLLAEGNATISTDKWHAVEAILVQAEKHREFAEWREAEQESEIMLHPQRFFIPDLAPPVDDSAQAPWLHDPLALQQWVATLEARKDQFDALDEALARAVGDAEEVVLPLLRNILVMQTVAPGDTLAEKADWLDRRLLIDTHMDGCHMTTHVSEAIETLQRLIRGIYTQEHIEAMEHLTLDAVEDYEAEWPVIGSYPTWRAFMLAYLYPENLLHVSPAPRQSYGFARLKEDLPGRVTPAKVCTAAEAYGDYFRDVCQLEVQASCQIKTFVGEDESCEPVTTTAPSTLHLFARAQTSGKVYWARLDPSKGFTDTTTTWKPVRKFGVVEQILGATPHFTPNGRRFVLVFFSVRKLGKMELRFAKYDVDRLRWFDDVDLELPGKAANGFSAAVIQKRGAEVDLETGDLGFPTLVAIKSNGGQIFLNQLNQEAVNWESDSWTRLLGPRMIDSFGNVVALIERTSNEYVILAERTGNFEGIYYRLLYRIGKGRDDLAWKELTGFSDNRYRGGFLWFAGRDTYLFYSEAGSTLYKRLGMPGSIKPENESRFRYHHNIDADEPEERARQIAEDIVKFNDEWLEPYVGVSLRDYQIKKFRPNFFVPHEDTGPPDVTEDSTVDPLDPDRANVKEIEKEGRFGFSSFSLNLLELFTYELKAADISIPDDARFQYNPGHLEFYLIQLQHQYVTEFLAYIADIDSAQTLEGDLGLWKFADEQIKKFSYEGLSLGDLVDRFRANIVEPYLSLYVLHSKGIRPGVQSTSFRERDTSSELSVTRTVAAGENWFFVPTSGDRRAPGLFPMKAVVIQKSQNVFASNGPFWARLRRDENALSWHKLPRLAPHGSGPFDILPERDAETLLQRKLDIEVMYEPHLDAPASVQMYLNEAYNRIPILLGWELQRNGHYDEALLWYRQVFNYLAPAGERKIDYSLVQEQNLTLSYDDAEEWLDDASDAHAIAATRKNTYTRHILLMIIRCLIDYADALFSHDNVTDNARARELYTTALKLLDFKVLKPGKSRCADIIGRLEVEVVEPGQLPLQQFQAVLAEIQDPDRLEEVVTRLRDISQDTDRDAADRLEDMHDIVRAELEAIPAPKTMTAVLDDKRQTIRTLENRYLAHRPSRYLLQKTHQLGRQGELSAVAEVTDTSEEVLLRESPPLPWLRDPRPDGSGDGAIERRRDLTLFNPNVSRRLVVLGHIQKTLPLRSLAAIRPRSFAIPTGISFDFCIPQNPVVTALRRRAENNLLKLRTCRNIAGMVRQLDPYGAPIGIGSGMVSPDGTIFSGIVEAPPTPYRYATLIARTKELVNIAQQIEAGYQAALENAEREALSALQAEQSAELAVANVTLRDLRLNQANSELGLAQLQKDGAVLRESTYAGWIAAGANEHEEKMLAAHRDASFYKQFANAAQGAAELFGLAAQAVGDKRLIFRVIGQGAVRRGVQAGLLAAQGAAIADATINQGLAIAAEARAQEASFEASFERRNDEWQLQQGLAALDVQIGDQQIQLAQDGIAIAQQERVIAGLKQTHAADILEFLLSKTFTEEMYRWIASVLEDVYRFFLQEAASIARLAERQLAFERQEAQLKIIQADYWNVPADGSGTTLTGDNVDRLGLTGSARLLKDVYQLEIYAHETRQRKQALTITLDLAEMFPAEFQRFRETGVLIFETPQNLIDRQMPGYYLCLIQQVSVSVVALVPPTHGIRASLTSAGTSRVVVGGDTFQTVTIRNQPERIALTAPTTTTGVIELEPDAQSLLRPFEGSGFDMLWELRMPEAANPFDYNTIATVLFTVELTALHSFDYERQVIEQMDRRLSANRAFYFRQEFADPWYDLHNPDQTATPMTVRFETRRADFPPNLENLRMEHVLLYFIGAGGESEEMVVEHFSFTEHQSSGEVGGGATSVDGVISTRRGNGTSWLPMIGRLPVGAWELALPNTTEVRDRFANEEIEDILLVLTIGGKTPAWPA